MSEDGENQSNWQVTESASKPNTALSGVESGSAPESGTEKRPSLAEVSNGIAQNALAKLSETVGKIKPETRENMSYAAITGALAIGGWYLVSVGIGQAGGIENFLQIAGQTLKDYQALLPNASPSEWMGIGYETKFVPLATAVATAATTFFAREAYRSQTGK